MSVEPRVHSFHGKYVYIESYFGVNIDTTII